MVAGAVAVAVELEVAVAVALGWSWRWRLELATVVLNDDEVISEHRVAKDYTLSPTYTVPAKDYGKCIGLESAWPETCFDIGSTAGNHRPPFVISMNTC